MKLLGPDWSVISGLYCISNLTVVLFLGQSGTIRYIRYFEYIQLLEFMFCLIKGGGLTLSGVEKEVSECILLWAEFWFNLNSGPTPILELSYEIIDSVVCRPFVVASMSLWDNIHNTSTRQYTALHRGDWVYTASHCNISALYSYTSCSIYCTAP